MLEIIKKPIITEKAMRLGDKRQYVFEVDPNANKLQIKKAIEELFEVNVVSIRTVRVKGKIRLRWTRRGVHRGKTPLRKKAYVTLKEGQSIELVTGAGT
ncbi:MAG: 50S ribosomal protein L23 [Ignavibacteria bacterium]|nr:50S ribosomal protein L23 [Ignavibacteria bacterium]